MSTTGSCATIADVLRTIIPEMKGMAMSYVTRLERYDELLEHYLKTVPAKERALEKELFASRVIGALSTKMSDEDWNEALVSTVDFAKKMQKLVNGEDK